MENERLGENSDKIDSINNEETNGSNKKSERPSGSSKDEIAEEVDTSDSKTFNNIAKRNINNETIRSSSVDKSVKWNPDSNNTTNEENSTINVESHNNGNTVGDENSKDSSSVASAQTIRKSITPSGKSNDKNRTQSGPRTKTKGSIVEKETPVITKCTIQCTKGIKGAHVKNGDGKGKCILCEVEKIIKAQERVNRSGSNRNNVSCGLECGRSNKEGTKKAEKRKKPKCMKSLDCKKTSPQCKTKTRPKRILSIRNLSETCLPPEKERSKKVICSTCPKSDGEDAEEKSEEGSEEENLDDRQSNGKKCNKKCQKIRDFCRKLCSCCGKKCKEKEDKENENEEEAEQNSSRKRKRRRKKKKKKKKSQRFPEGKKPPCAGKSNNMTGFYGKRPACHAGFGTCHPCYPAWTPARLPFFARSAPPLKKRKHSS